MKRLVYIFTLLISTTLFANEPNEEPDQFLVEKENILEGLMIELRSAPTDVERDTANARFIAELESILEYPGVLDYEFTKLTSVSTIMSPDGFFRIINWNVESDDYVHSHYCYVVRKGRGKKNIVHELDENLIMGPRPTGTLGIKNWYGALYYNIIPVKKGSRTLYTIMGFNGNNRSTNRKMLDVFYFKGKNMRMGYPLFQESEGSTVMLRRFFLEYSDKATVSLNLHQKLQTIVFDHLIPEQANLEGMYDFYIPDMSYDGFEWDGEMWKYRDDIVAYNDPNKKIRRYIPGDETDEDTFVDVNDTWVDPVDNTTPVPNKGSDATAPIEEADEDNKLTDTSNSEERKKNKKWFRGSKTRSAIGDKRAVKKNKKKKKLSGN